MVAWRKMAWWLPLVAAFPAVAHAQVSVKRACSPTVCVDIWSAGWTEGAGHEMRLKVRNQSDKTVAPFDFTVRHTCSGGNMEERRYHVALALEPGTETLVTGDDPVCAGAWQHPVGAQVGGLPGLRPASALKGRTPPEQTVGPAPHDPFLGPSWTHSACLAPLCLCGPTDIHLGELFPKGDSCGSGGGSKGDEGMLVLLVIAAVGVAVAVAVALALLLLAVGAVVGPLLGWGTAELAGRKSLHFLVNALLMDLPLALGLLTAAALTVAGGALSFGLLAQQNRYVQPAGAVVAVGTGVAALGAVVAGGVVGTTSVVVANGMLAPKKEEPVPEGAAAGETEFVEAVDVTL